MKRFIPVESFRKKGNTFRGISFFPLLPEFPNISVPFLHFYSVRLFTVILPRKNAKDLKDGGRFPKRLSWQYVSLLVGSVGGRFRTQLQPCRWKRITFCGRYLRFSFTRMIRASSVLPPELHRGKKCGCWLLVSRTKCGCCSSQKKKLSPSSPKKTPRFSKPSDKMSSTTGSSATMFLDMICTQTPTRWHPKIPIKWYGSIYFVSLVEKKCSTICPEKVTKNFILMVNAPDLKFSYLTIPINLIKILT